MRVGVGQFEEAIETPRMIIEFVEAKDGKPVALIPAESAAREDDDED